MADQLAKRFPLDTMVNGHWAPTIRTAIEINRGNPAKALDHLHALTVNDLAAPPPFQLGTLYPPYLRGQACLLLRRGSEAATEFQKFPEHRGVVQNCSLGALAACALPARLLCKATPPNPALQPPVS